MAILFDTVLFLNITPNEMEFADYIWNEFLMVLQGSIAVETTKIMEITIVSVNNITRETDVVGKIDPYVIVSWTFFR